MNAWDDFHRVEHGALVVPAGGAKFLAPMLFVWRCSPDMEAATSVIMSCGVSDKPQFVAEDIVAVQHEHLEVEAAPCAPSRDARGSCRWNCADTCKQQSNGLTHHI